MEGAFELKLTQQIKRRIISQIAVNDKHEVTKTVVPSEEVKAQDMVEQLADETLILYVGSGESGEFITLVQQYNVYWQVNVEGIRLSNVIRLRSTIDPIDVEALSQYCSSNYSIYAVPLDTFTSLIPDFLEQAHRVIFLGTL